MNRSLANDPELAAHFQITGEEIVAEDHDDGTPSDDRYVVVRCKGCVKAWEVLLTDGTIAKGERNALLAHAKAHAAPRRMRPI